MKNFINELQFELELRLNTPKTDQNTVFSSKFNSFLNRYYWLHFQAQTLKMSLTVLLIRHHNTQQNDIQQNDTQHKGHTGDPHHS